MGGLVNETRGTHEEGVEQADCSSILPIRHNQWKDGPNLGVEIKADPEVVGTRLDESGGTSEHNEGGAMFVALNLDGFVEGKAPFWVPRIRFGNAGTDPKSNSENTPGHGVLSMFHTGVDVNGGFMRNVAGAINARAVDPKGEAIGT